MKTNHNTIPTINIEEKIQEVAGRPWYPIEVARVNDQVVRMALCKGEYHWHKHTNEDELFYVLKGQLTIQMKEPYSDITLIEGELAVIPKGVEHCPKSSVDTYILMFEPYELQSRGD
jgi:mannose-6-phosphate isomerase-like protein (cupin superfamily)